MNTSPIGILLLNTGTPDNTHISTVRRYLRQFLFDPRIIDLPAWLRWPLVQLITLFRAKRSAQAYKQIWTQAGSPLAYHSQQLVSGLSSELGQDYKVVIGMRYGNPSIASAIETLQAANCRQIIVLPLFPQYSSAASGSVIEEALTRLAKRWNIPPVSVCEPFFDHPLFINAFSNKINKALKAQSTQAELLLFSYHGIPERHLDKAQSCQPRCDRQSPCPKQTRNHFCYRSQCYETSRKIAENISNVPHEISFQSRLGRLVWTRPYTEQILNTLRERGIQHLAVACPSFIADCLETLEEIGIRLKAQWQALGGETLTLIPTLNSDPEWVSALTNIIHSKTEHANGRKA